MKLYYTPGACSLTVHIVLNETGLPYDLGLVDLQTHKTEQGEDFLAINPKGYVPALELEDKQVLTEVTAIVQYLADRVPDRQLIPVAGGLERVRLQEWLGFISSELHKSFGLLYDPSIPEDSKEATLARLMRRFEFLEQHLQNQEYLVGQKFSVADAYLFNILFWAAGFGMNFSKLEALSTYNDRLAGRPGVQATLQQEGLSG